MFYGPAEIEEKENVPHTCGNKQGVYRCNPPISCEHAVRNKGNIPDRTHGPASMMHGKSALGYFFTLETHMRRQHGISWEMTC